MNSGPAAYDSTADTLKHARRVQELLGEFAIAMIKRGMVHDDSKLGPVEKPAFDRETPLLKGLTYGSDEYKNSLVRLGKALEHHYAHNSHHPEFYRNGVNDMTLMDVVEMFFDWKAASERNAGGFEIDKSVERFGITPQLAQIMKNTALELGWIDRP